MRLRRLQRQTLASTPGAADVCSFAITSPEWSEWDERHARSRYGVRVIEGKVTRAGARMEPRGREQHRWANREVEWSFLEKRHRR